MITQKHPFHLVDPSPWPLVGSTAAFICATGGTLYIHNFSGGGSAFYIGFFLLLFTIVVWWRDIIREGTFEGQHNSIVQLGLRFGIILFIVSEIIFFFAFFWAFFWASLAPVPEIGSVWPPKGIETLKAFEVPFLNTIVLLLSGFSVTWAHHAIVVGSKKESINSLAITILLAMFFTFLQVLEYFSANFSISDGIYGSTFFIATGFHGFHVFIGTCFLIVCFFRILAYHFTKQHHFGFEAAAWYWHFVDVVWLFLFVSIYWWGNSILYLMFIINNPLEQFEIISLFNFGFSFSNANLFCFFSIFFILFASEVASTYNKGFFIPSRIQIFFENLYIFILSIVNENIGKKGQAFFPLIISLFFFLIFSNAIGLVPYSFTITSHFLLTFSLSLIIWVGKLLIGFKENGLKFFGLLLPGGVPIPIIPFFVGVELLSFFIPLVALGVRLFANIIAGHILLKVIVGFCWSIITAGSFLFAAHFIPIFVLFLLLFLETAVAFIQAYIFTILSCLAIGDAIKGGHLFFLLFSLVA